MTRKKKKVKQRPFTPGEITEVQRIVLRCFTGRGTEADMARAFELMKISPDEYTKISNEVREEERRRLRGM